MTAHPSVQLPLCLAHYLNYHENTTAQPPPARLSRKSLAAAAQFSKPIFTVTDQLIPLARSLSRSSPFSPLLMQFTSETASAQLYG